MSSALCRFRHSIDDFVVCSQYKSDAEFVRHLQDTVDAIKQNRSMEERYMLLEEMMRNEKQEGIQQGSHQMLIQCLVDFLEAKFSVSDTMVKKIESETNICKLQAWFQLSLKVSSIEEFEKNM